MRRKTDDLDFFAQRGGDVGATSDALIAACEGWGWQVETVRAGADFRRLRVTRPSPDSSESEELHVDLALDAPPVGAPTVTIAGPSLAPRELAIRETLALFGRAEPRDSADVHALHRQFDRAETPSRSRGRRRLRPRGLRADAPVAPTATRRGLPTHRRARQGAADLLRRLGRPSRSVT